VLLKHVLSMDWEEALGNEAFEELRVRLERWEELCAQLRGLYYRYIDLAAFRSEKCYFPGRRCKRPWRREYDLGDLTLVWTYITNTAPLCGRLMRALTKVEERFRQMGLESLEKHGGVEERSIAVTEIVHWRLAKPAYATATLWENRLYVFYDDVPLGDGLRGDEMEEIAWEAEQAGVSVKVYDVDEEYMRLWLEVPLPRPVSGLLGRCNRAPVALFRNLGWLLSDDARKTLKHAAGNPGQVATRLFDWIALAKYAMERRIAPRAPLVVKLSIYLITRSKRGKNPIVEVRPVGTAAETISAVYDWFGITLGRAEEVLARGYLVLKALKEEAFKRDGKMYVVNDVGAWIAFSNAVAALVLGDGYAMPAEFRVAAKASPRETLEGVTTRIKELAEALGGVVTGREVKLQSWHMRLLLPTPPTPAFEKTAELFETLANYPAAAVVEINSATYLLTHNGGGEFVIGRGKAAELYDAVNRLGIQTRLKGQLLVLIYAQLEELAKQGFAVRLLNDVEKDAVREVKPVTPAPDPDAVRRVLEEVAKMARIVVATDRGRLYIRIIPHDKSKVEEIAAKLRAMGIRAVVLRKKKEVRIHEQKSVEIIRRIAPHFFYPFTFLQSHCCKIKVPIYESFDV